MEAEQTAEVNAIVFNVAATMQHIFRIFYFFILILFFYGRDPGLIPKDPGL
jgi:hypothetical protein